MLDADSRCCVSALSAPSSTSGLDRLSVAGTVGRIISSEICENHAAHNELPVEVHVRSNYGLTRTLIVRLGSKVPIFNVS